MPTSRTRIKTHFLDDKTNSKQASSPPSHGLFERLDKEGLGVVSTQHQTHIKKQFLDDKTMGLRVFQNFNFPTHLNRPAQMSRLPVDMTPPYPTPQLHPSHFQIFKLAHFQIECRKFALRINTTAP